MDLKKYKVDIHDYVKCEFLGQGAFGNVFLVKNKSNELLAAKVMYFNSEDNRVSINREVNIMSSLNHSTMIRFRGFSLTGFDDESAVTIFMDYMKNGSLAKICYKDKRPPTINYDSTTKQIILIGIAYGMKLFHEKQGIHRDLKPDNILLDEQLHPVITDFGCSKFLDINNPANTGGKGTPFYMAPEINEDDYDQKVDVYSFGIIMFEVVTESFCYPNLKITSFRLFEKVKDENFRPKFTEPIKQSFKNLIELCWSGNPTKRPSFGKIFQCLAFGKENDEIIDVFSDDENDKKNEYKYYLDGIDVDKVQSYVHSIINENSESGSEMKQKVTKFKKHKLNENDRYISIDAGFLIYEQKDENHATKEIVFVPPDFEGRYMIPGEITSIGQSVFKEHQGIKSFNSRYSSLQTIKNNCFYRCENLESIDVRSYSELKFDDFCFSQCHRLSSVEIESKDLLIGKNCFENCSSLLSVNLTVTDNIILSSRAFKNCSSLNAIMIKCESSAINVLDECFYDLENLKTIAFIGRSVTLGNGFINKCASLSLITINSQQDIIITPNTFGLCNLNIVKLNTTSKLKLEDSCFMSSSKLENVDLTFDSIEIGKDCFSDCKNLTFISIQSGKDIEIDDAIISGCPSLLKLSLSSNSKLNIRDKFMNGFSSIREIELNGFEICIGKECFTNCESLSIFSVVKSGKIEMKETQFKNCNKLESISIQCSDVILQPNQFLNFRSLKNVKIESDSQIILKLSCFSGCSNISTFLISGSDISIDDECFNGCSKLNNFVLPKTSNLKLGSNVFYNCSNLYKVNFETASELIIGDKCFNGSEIKEATFKGKKVQLGVECFVNKKFFSSSKIETCNIICENVLICKECFRGCKNLKSFSITSSANIKLCTSSFEGCKNLETVLLKSENTLKLNRNCFLGSSSLKSFDFTGKDIHISDYCFCFCGSLQSFTNQNSDTIILGHNSFECCSSLEKFEVTANLEFTAGDFCLNGLQKLKTVKIISKKVSINDFTLANCPLLISFSLPTAEEFTFYDSSFLYCYSIKYYINRNAILSIFKSKKIMNQNFYFYNFY